MWGFKPYSSKWMGLSIQFSGRQERVLSKINVWRGRWTARLGVYRAANDFTLPLTLSFPSAFLGAGKKKNQSKDVYSTFLQSTNLLSFMHPFFYFFFMTIPETQSLLVIEAYIVPHFFFFLFYEKWWQSMCFFHVKFHFLTLGKYCTCRHDNILKIEDHGQFNTPY